MITEALIPGINSDDKQVEAAKKAVEEKPRLDFCAESRQGHCLIREGCPPLDVIRSNNISHKPAQQVIFDALCPEGSRPSDQRVIRKANS